jgi:predicted aconitase with swiveling domain
MPKRRSVERRLKGRALVAGAAAGRAVVAREPLSFWGGVDPRTGEIIDRRHALSGTVVTGTVFLLPVSKGSSTGSAVLLEGIRNGSAPAAVVTARPDPMLALGAIVADELYRKTIPVVALAPRDFKAVRDGDRVAVEPDGTVRVTGGTS